ncbi:hypothetical protein RQP46_009485 [Phenoliferia psychrophenolica]
MSDHPTCHATFVYKEVRGTQYKADLYLPDDSSLVGSSQESLPLLVFFHGGGLLIGSRTAFLPRWLLQEALNAGFAFISADYTLLVPGNGHALIEDVKDLFTWITSDLNGRLADLKLPQVINSERIVSAGSSAGGLLSYLAGLYAMPKPKALAPIYGLAGLLDFWVDKQTEPFMRDDDGILLPLHPSNAPWLHLIHAPASAPPVVETTLDPTKDARHGFLLWLLQTGEFTDYLTGVPGLGAKLAKLDKKDRGAALPAAAKVLFPTVMADKNFPPTFLVSIRTQLSGFTARLSTRR